MYFNVIFLMNDKLQTKTQCNWNIFWNKSCNANYNLWIDSYGILSNLDQISVTQKSAKISETETTYPQLDPQKHYPGYHNTCHMIQLIVCTLASWTQDRRNLSKSCVARSVMSVIKCNDYVYCIQETNKIS